MSSYVTAERHEKLEDMYAKYSSTVYRLAFRLTGSPADAEDVVQDLFLGLPDALRTYEERGRFGSWLHAIAARLAMDRIRRRTRRREVTLSAADRIEAPRHPEAVDHVLLERALQGLPDALRTVIVLKEIEGFTHAEIAHALGISVAASKVRLHRAYAALRQLLRS